jgi:hypothetical protein
MKEVADQELQLGRQVSPAFTFLEKSAAEWKSFSGKLLELLDVRIVRIVE